MAIQGQSILGSAKDGILVSKSSKDIVMNAPNTDIFDHRLVTPLLQGNPGK